MNSNLFRKPSDKTESRENSYEKFGFFRNPFPTKPSVNVGSPDPRENGAIYLPNLRQEQQRRFEELLIPTSGRTQVRSIAFLMDYATRRGRGIGKTSFLFHQRQRIMKDLGNELTGGTNVLFSAYVLPEPEGRQRKFWQFCKLVTEFFVAEDNPIICLAMWRLRAFSGLIPDDLLEKASSEPEQTIGDNRWLRNNNIDVDFGLNNVIKNQLLNSGIDYSLANALVHHGHSVSEFYQKYLQRMTDSIWRKDGPRILFDDLVKLFTIAGFTKGIVLIDEMEKVVQPQNTGERRAFTEALRYFLIDGQCENARVSFYSFFLTIHPYVQEILNPHWEASGLDRFAALGRELSPEYTVYFDPLDQESARPLALAYLDESRLQSNQRGSYTPFKLEALDEALIKSGKVPGRYLTLLNNAIERALIENWETIGTREINNVIRLKAPKEPSDTDTLDILPVALTNLQENDQ